MSELTEPLEWDTSFFGFPIGRVRPDAADVVAAAEEADQRGYVCTYLRVDEQDPGVLLAAQRAGFLVVGTRAELVAGRLDSSPDTGVEVADPTVDGDWVRELARTRFTDSRFHVDPGFGEQAAGRMFEAWVERGFADRERELLVLDDSGGFVLCGADPTRGEGAIELIASSADGHGHGRRLVQGAHAWFAARGLPSARVVTQGANVRALRLYESCGYRTRATALWLHRWRSAAGPDAS